MNDDKPVEITMYAQDYFADESKFIPRKCYLCGKMIEKGYELDFIMITFPEEPLLPRSLPVHGNCKLKGEGGFTLTVE